ncbi:MAG TPA: HD domain-containing protein, partial [Candidatus Deferrimicrobiaceae bacterium]
LAILPADELAGCGFRFVDPVSAAPIWFRHVPPFGKVEVTPLESAERIPGDLRRRDFTVNAIAMDLSGTLIDPLGGKADAESRTLRACSPATFLDDPVRIFRAFRFEADGWRMAPSTEALLRESVRTVPDVFGDIPHERFSREMLKALAGADPARFFLKMDEHGAGHAFLPELFHMPRVPAGSSVHHPEGDLFTHSIQVLQRLSKKSADPLARFCAFFHDLGKLATDPALLPKHHGHEEAGFDSASPLCDRLRLPAVYRRALAWTCRLHGNGHRWAELRDATRVTMGVQAIAAGVEGILPMVCDADRAGKETMPGWDDVIRVARMTTSDLGIDRARLEGMDPADRAPFILQRRVEALRAGSSRSNQSPEE